jgi:hypothetical protein
MKRMQLRRRSERAPSRCYRGRRRRKYAQISFYCLCACTTIKTDAKERLHIMKDIINVATDSGDVLLKLLLVFIK